MAGVYKFFTRIQCHLDPTSFDAQEVSGPGENQGMPLGGERDGRFGSLFPGVFHRQVQGQTVIAIEIRQAAAGVFGLVLGPERLGSFQDAIFFRGRKDCCCSCK